LSAAWSKKQKLNKIHRHKTAIADARYKVNEPGFELLLAAHADE
jgi:hypothetical protein